MNNPGSVHILNQMGVITAFSVAKKVTEVDIHKFCDQQKKIGKKDSEIEKLMKERILGEIQDAVVNHKVPGLLTPQELAQEMNLDKNIIENIPELNRIIMVIAHKLSEKKFNKMSLCYFINSLVNIMGLGEKDFERFHRHNNKDESDEGDDGDNSYKDA